MPHHHLVTVWNPAYATDALEAHLQVLLAWDERARNGKEASADDVYVWWGKVRSSQRQQPMPHLNDVLALDGALDPEGVRETHLYLTDYRSLYVADIGEITRDDPRDETPDHVPAYYAESGLHCDCWFQVLDIRVLVRDDLEGVTLELTRLRNTRYHDRPVSIYGGMVDLPLLVSRPDERRFFDDREREQLTDGVLWARFDAQQGGTGAMETVLRDDHFGERAWRALDPAARHFIASAERTFREHRRDRGADLSSVMVSYAKALEVQLNLMLHEVMANAPDAARLVKVNNATRRLPEDLPLTLGALAHALGGEPALGQHLRTTLDDGAWLTAGFAAIADEFAQVRNRCAHPGEVTREEVVRWRDRMLGVGGEGVVGRLALVRGRGS